MCPSTTAQMAGRDASAEDALKKKLITPWGMHDLTARERELAFRMLRDGTLVGVAQTRALGAVAIEPCSGHGPEGRCDGGRDCSVVTCYAYNWAKCVHAVREKLSSDEDDKWRIDPRLRHVLEACDESIQYPDSDAAYISEEWSARAPLAESPARRDVLDRIQADEGYIFNAWDLLDGNEHGGLYSTQANVPFCKADGQVLSKSDMWQYKEFSLYEKMRQEVQDKMPKKTFASIAGTEMEKRRIGRPPNQSKQAAKEKQKEIEDTTVPLLRTASTGRQDVHPKTLAHARSPVSTPKKSASANSWVGRPSANSPQKSVSASGTAGGPSTITPKKNAPAGGVAVGPSRLQKRASPGGASFSLAAVVRTPSKAQAQAQAQAQAERPMEQVSTSKKKRTREEIEFDADSDEEKEPKRGVYESTKLPG
ncbi:hypothetical protein FVE85_4903 [Porphyridium purpureum]|uniref:Uncharacterized protein n=1 Tax=Porphyridium purpureum TaxID=35688 RepID=A0A5J4YR48_PORPP|nr:hypothetical protein FVE85_4903 [Porphyridium purpureum]|eukprot:POR3107..scf236_6